MITCHNCGFGHRTFEELRACKPWCSVCQCTGVIQVRPAGAGRYDDLVEYEPCHHCGDGGEPKA